MVGVFDGLNVGEKEGTFISVGDCVGRLDGKFEGDSLGKLVGEVVGV